MRYFKRIFYPVPMPLAMIWHFILGSFIGAAFGQSYVHGLTGGFVAIVAGLVYWALVLKAE